MKTLQGTAILILGWAVSTLAFAVVLGRVLGFGTYIVIFMAVPNCIFHVIVKNHSIVKIRANVKTESRGPFLFKPYAVFLACVTAILCFAAIGIEEVRLVWRWTHPAQLALVYLVCVAQWAATEYAWNLKGSGAG